MTDMTVFPEIKKNFGFGMMRLPMNGKTVDTDQMNCMVDRFIADGFNYFDTARGYLDGESEKAFKTCVADRYPRDAYVLTDKLTNAFFKTQEDIRTCIDYQLETCGVEYFDFYLMHCQTKGIHKHFKRNNAFEEALKLKEEGKFRHFGISFHDTADFLEQLLTEYPQIELVQIQLNYLDYEDPAVQGRQLLEVCKKYNKPVMVMEPVKGGCLANLPKDAAAVLDELNAKKGTKDSYPSYAIRFAASCEPVRMVLSGMSTMEQMDDNAAFMKEFEPLSQEELAAVEKVADVFSHMDIIPCTACRYCTKGCPMELNIPDIFSCINGMKVFNTWNQEFYYNVVHTRKGHRASDCIKCGKCESACPQHLEIRKLLEEAVELFEKKKEQ